MALSGAARGQIRWIVDRMHVGMSNAEVRADILRRLERVPADQLSAGDRRAAVAWALRCHRQNQELYRSVMGGM